METGKSVAVLGVSYMPVPKPNIIYAITGVAECLSLCQVFDIQGFLH